MTMLKGAGWSLRQLIPGSIWREKIAGAGEAKPNSTVVSLRKAQQHSPSTLITERIATTLRKTGSLSYETLVETVADDLYQEELRKGAAVLDIGLFGSRLFHREVIAELQAGDGIFWEIKKQRVAA